MLSTKAVDAVGPADDLRGCRVTDQSPAAGPVVLDLRLVFLDRLVAHAAAVPGAGLVGGRLVAGALLVIAPAHREECDGGDQNDQAAHGENDVGRVVRLLLIAAPAAALFLLGRLFLAPASSTLAAACGGCGTATLGGCAAATPAANSLPAGASAPGSAPLAARLAPAARGRLGLAVEPYGCPALLAGKAGCIRFGGDFVLLAALRADDDLGFGHPVVSLSNQSS